MSNRSNGLIKNDLVNSHHGKSRHRFIMLGCMVLGGNYFSLQVDIKEVPDISFLQKAIKAEKEIEFRDIDYDGLKLWKVEIPAEDDRLDILKNAEIDINSIANDLGGVKYLNPMFSITKYFSEDYIPPKEHVHIIVQPPPATTGTIHRSLLIPMKRPIEFQDYNREPVPPREGEFWNELSKARIVLKLPVDVNRTIYTLEPLSKYMKVEGNEIVLGENIMMNSQDELIFCNGDPVIESEKKITMNFVKFLRLCKSPDGIVYGITTQDILIKKSYLQLIEKLEFDRINQGTKGCVIIGSPGIGKTHFSLYFTFYITRRYNSDDIIYEQLFKEEFRLLYIRPNMSVMRILDPKREDPENSFYIADSVVPSPWKTKYICLVTTPKNSRWHELSKRKGVITYYASIWTEEEIWSVWRSSEEYMQNITEDRVKEIITRWGCIPRRVFVDHEKEQKIKEILPFCDIYSFLKDENLSDAYSGKIIHIVPSPDFRDRTFVVASDEVLKTLYKYYEEKTKDEIIRIIKDFARTACGSLAGKFFEMIAHDILRKGGKFKYRKLTQNITNDNYNTLELQQLEYKEIRDINEIESSHYNVPESQTFETVDALTPEYNGEFNYLYQMTISETHKIKVNGLDKLKSKIKNSLPIFLFFVVPHIEDLFCKYKLQNFVTTGNTTYVGWDNNGTSWIRDDVIQYVLEIDL